VDAIEALELLRKKLSDRSKYDTIGALAASMIAGHIYDGPFTPLSPATKAYRGANAKPLQDTGHLHDSITYKVNGSGADATIVVGTNHVAARIQNDGGTIRAKKNWLWIPSGEARESQRNKGSGFSPTEVLRHYKAMGFKVLRIGRTIAYQSKKRKMIDGKLKYVYHTLYYLKKEVTIPARKFFYLDDKELSVLIKELGI
jgi:phage gpG-like protein